MRIVALEAMEALARFTPRLIGSVATGHVRSGSDVDLHVFAWDAVDVEAHVRALGWVHETQRVSTTSKRRSRRRHASPGRSASQAFVVRAGVDVVG
jgi:predicted nucleotidyltransferase